MAVRILGPLEFTLGALTLKPMTRGEVLQLAEDYRRMGRSPLLDQDRVEAALRMLQQAGALHPAPGGALQLDPGSLHPAYRAIARAAANAIANGLGGAGGDDRGGRG